MFNQIILTIKPYFLDNPVFDGSDKDAIRLADWLRERKGSPNTFVTYRVVVFRFYLWMKFKKIKLKRISRSDIFEYIDFMKKPDSDWCGNRRHFKHHEWRPFKEGLTVYSINHNIQILRQLFSELTEFKYLRKNPYPKKVNLESKVKGLPISRYLTKPECQQIIKYINELPAKNYSEIEFKVRMKWVILFLLYTACRRCELNGATMQSFFYRNNKLWIEVIGKGNQYGVVPILKPLEDALNEYRAFYGLPSLANRTMDESHIPVVIKSRQGTVYQGFHHTTIWHNIKSICNSLADLSNEELFVNKLRRVSTHWFRHTSATLQVDAGIEIRIVQQVLRHKSIDTTMRYQHVDQDRQHDEMSAKFII